MPSVDRDLGPGSLQIDFVQSSFGLIYWQPILGLIGVPSSAWWKFDVKFSPVFMPTWSTLHLVNAQQVDDSYPIVSYDNSRFHEFVVQTTSLEHNAVSSETQSAIGTWLTGTTDVVIGYDLIDGGAVVPETHQVQRLDTIEIDVSEKVVNLNGTNVTYVFVSWEDGSTENPRRFAPWPGVVHTATMKAHLASDASGVAWLGGQRRVAEGVDGVGPTQHMVYESGGDIWYLRNRHNGGWEPERLFPHNTWESPRHVTIAAEVPVVIGNEDIVFVQTAWTSDTWSIHYRTSDDNGMTWEPVVSHDVQGEPSAGNTAGHHLRPARLA